MQKRLLIIMAAVVLAFFMLGNQMSVSYMPLEKPKITMVWDYVGSVKHNRAPEKAIAHEGLDILAPTYFVLKERDGYIDSVADSYYVGQAHAKGYQVWAMFTNEFNEEIPYLVFSDALRRKEVVAKLLELCDLYNLDGINLDFEGMTKETYPFFELFVQELYAELRPESIVLSIDVPFPRYTYKLYDYTRLLSSVDYIVIMAYDQHYIGTKPGPMAEKNWVKEGLEDALLSYPAEKVILGVPFYTRIWYTKMVDENETIVPSREYGMAEAYDFFAARGAEIYREEDSEQLYAEYTEGAMTYRAWLEDDHSLSLKLDMVHDYHLAGMAAWRRGLELEEIWHMVYAYYKKDY